MVKKHQKEGSIKLNIGFLDAIDSLLKVNPPKEIDKAKKKRSKSTQVAKGKKPKG